MDGVGEVGLEAWDRRWDSSKRITLAISNGTEPSIHAQYPHARLTRVIGAQNLVAMLDVGKSPDEDGRRVGSLTASAQGWPSRGQLRLIADVAHCPKYEQSRRAREPPVMRVVAFFSI